MAARVKIFFVSTAFLETRVFLASVIMFSWISLKVRVYKSYHLGDRVLVSLFMTNLSVRSLCACVSDRYVQVVIRRKKAIWKNSCFYMDNIKYSSSKERVNARNSRQKKLISNF